MKLRTKLVLSILAGSLFISVSAGLASFYYAKSALEKVISAEHLTLAKQTTSKIDQLIFERYLDIQTISGSTALRGFLADNVPHEEGQARFERLKETTGPWSTILVADKDGNIVFSDDSRQAEKNINPADYPHNYLALKEALGGKTYYSDVVMSKITDKPTIIFASPVRSSDHPDSEIVGVIIGQFDWTTIYSTLAEIGTAHAHIYNSRGIMIGSNLEEQNHNILKDDRLQTEIHSHFLEEDGMSMITRSKEDSFDSLTSHLRFSGYREYAGHRWTLLLETPVEVAFASALSGALMQGLIIIFSSLVFFLVVIFIINRLVVRPLNIFIGVAQEITKGNLDASIKIKGKDEIGQLAEAFNNMITELKLAREDVEKKVAERTTDLEKINKFMVGREIKMIDLKKRIDDLTKNQCRKD